MIGLESQSFLELTNRFVHAALLVEHDSEIIVRIRISRVEPEGLLVMPDGLGDLAILVQRVTKVIVSAGIIWLEAEGFLVFRDGFNHTALVFEGDAEVVRGLQADPKGQVTSIGLLISPRAKQNSERSRARRMGG